MCLHAQLCLTLCSRMDCTLPGSSVHRATQARIPEWVAVFYSSRSFQPREQTHASCNSCIGKWILYHCTTWEAPYSNNLKKIALRIRIMVLSRWQQWLRTCRRHKRRRFIPWSERSPGGEDGNPLQYSCLDDPVDSVAWWAAVHWVTKNQV